MPARGIGRPPVNLLQFAGAVTRKVETGVSVVNPSRFRWSIILLLFCINIVNYIDRSAISFAVHLIQEQFGLSASQIGLILGAFGIGYALTTFVGGFLADRFGGRLIFAVAVVVWSLSIGWAGAATGFVMLYCARLALGLAEGPTFPAHARIVERWLPPHERATAVAVALIAIPIALAVGAPLVSTLVDAAGWRVMFFILAGLGLVWLPFWLIALLALSSVAGLLIWHRPDRDIARLELRSG